MRTRADATLGLLLYTGTGDADVIVEALASGVRHGEIRVEVLPPGAEPG